MDERLRAGVVAFNAGAFYEAHEIWEQLWNDTIGDDRVPLQGLIQIAAGYHKHELGVPAGALTLLTRGLARLRSGSSWPLAIDLDALCAAVELDLRRLRLALDAALSPPILRYRT